MVNMEDQPLRIAVVGHTNAGKTSLLRTLARRADFGEVSDRPGTTRHVERIELAVRDRAAVHFFDTPGLEDAVSLREHIDRTTEAATPPERIRQFLRGPEAHGVFEQEAKVLRALLDVDAAFLVIDAREPVLPKYRDEIELLRSCARPVLPVLNFVRDPASREAAWKELLAAYGMHAVVRFDAAAPFVGAERDLYQDLITLLRDRRPQLEAVVESLAREAAERRDAAASRIAELLVDVAALRRQVAAADFEDEARRAPQVAQLQQTVFDKAQRCTSDLLTLYRFRDGDAAEAPLPLLEGRWSMDFFSPEAMKDAGLRLGKGAAVGAAVGVVADLAAGGLSLGAGAALGGVIGGAISQGLGPLGRKLFNTLRDVHELSVDDGVLFVLADWQRALVRALERRGHAATSRIQVEPPRGAGHTQALSAAVRATAPARSHPEWARPPGRQRMDDSPQRRQAVTEAARHIALSIGTDP
jgi:GTPase Era involved in 16S rRNA processing